MEDEELAAAGDGVDQEDWAVVEIEQEVALLIESLDVHCRYTRYPGTTRLMTRRDEMSRALLKSRLVSSRAEH